MSQHSQSSDPLADFGANEWLVDEMYDQYLKDKGSVDASWQKYFAATHATPPTTASTAATAPHPAARAGRRQPAPAAPGPAPAAPARARRASRAGRRAAPTPQPAPSPRQAAPAKPAAKAPATSDDSERTPLRGPAARVVANMETSLTVPTATSVRAVPAKLLIDNRIVVNNHLARSRGGKVSFTHLIGYAAVKAVTAMPEMNRGYAEIDGKPVAGDARRT